MTNTTCPGSTGHGADSDWRVHNKDAVRYCNTCNGIASIQYDKAGQVHALNAQLTAALAAQHARRNP
ncbi:hypothetical protein GCM10022243_48630 [Saccharothrix violaceirubra]|uniref:Uncharacterized protein n=1 Tax=Saccharothrix violaceirubra TaxID=413306 RepID=A0A7W7T1U2_9PSEU|nr:hypothetical protein [Saccharothrix violaceirubra]MBB4963795.1 hypothetical protein [Saccharothrix violaceirubra]